MILIFVIFGIEGNIDYLRHLRSLRDAYILKPNVLTQELFDATFIKQNSTDDWPEIVKFLQDNSPIHQNVKFAESSCVFVDFNGDGVKLFKSGVEECVPLLARISAIVSDIGDTFLFSRPLVYLVGMYMGEQKPTMDDLLVETVDEFLRRHPTRNERFRPLNQGPRKTFKRFSDYMTAPWNPDLTYQHEPSTDFRSIYLGIDRLIADAPARKDFSGTIGHGGYFAPPRCIQRGERNDNLGLIAFKTVRCKDIRRYDEDYDSYKEPEEGDKKVKS
jgi:hypothetical protein